jgi:hypothetical protein
VPTLAERLGGASTLLKSIFALISAGSVLAVDQVLLIPEAISSSARLVLALGSVVCILFIIFSTPRICRLRSRSAILLLLLLTLCGIAAVVGFENLRDSKVRHPEGVGEVIVPVFPSRDLAPFLADMRARFRTNPDDAYTHEYSGRLARTRVATEAWKTRLALLLLLLAAQVSIFLAVFGSVWKLYTADQETGKGVTPPPLGA